MMMLSLVETQTAPVPFADPKSLVAEVIEPRGRFNPPQYIVADVRPKSLRVYHTLSMSDAYDVRNAWRRGNFATAGEKREFA